MKVVERAVQSLGIAVIFVMPFIASNFVITFLIITLNKLLYRTTRLINPISSDLLGQRNEF